MHERSRRAARDLHLYRVAWLPAALAVVVMMFSLEGAPDPLEPAIAPTFEADRAVAEARRITAAAPEREPGSAGDSEVAELVAARFEEIPAGAVAEQRFTTEYEGEEVELRNVLLTLPGTAESSIVVAAARDSATGAAGTPSAAATAVLLELAAALGVAGHEKTYVLASTSGASTGAAGARELLASLPERDSVEAVIMISHPASADPSPPFVLTTSTDQSSGPVQLERTAELAVETQAQLPSPRPSPLTQLARLAIPAGLGGQAPLIAAGFDAVAISSTGERPPAGGADGLEGETLGGFGRAIQATVAAVDVATGPLEPGPGAYLELGGNLLPGWTLALLGLALLLPPAITASAGCARIARAGEPILDELARTAARALPFVGALAMLYALALAGAIPRPPFPFDPASYGFGARATITLALILLAGVASGLLLRHRRAAADRAAWGAVPAAGVIVTLACLLLWLANPYLALLLVPTAHLWLLCGGTPGRMRGVGVMAASALALVPAIAAVVAVGAALELGPGAAWPFALMVADGQIGLAVTVPICFLAGALVAGVTMASRRPPADAGSPGPRMGARPQSTLGEPPEPSDER